MNDELKNIFNVNNASMLCINKEADVIQEFMNTSYNIQDPAALVYRLQNMDGYMSRLSDMMIRVKAMKERVQNAYLNTNEDSLSKMTATKSNRLINAHLYEYKITYDRLDAMYHTIEHLSKNLVTQISYIKEQMRSFSA